MFLLNLNNNRKKAILIFSFFAFVFLSSALLYNLNFSSASIDCCYHECNLTDPDYCVGNIVYECRSNCDNDIYQDFCEIEDCSLTNKICVKGICQEATCFDNTLYNTCSTNTGAPWYCNNTGSLIENCGICGCTGSWICGPTNTFCCDNQCNSSCSPAGCTVAYDPDCGCQNNNGCCGIGCNNANDNDCAVSDSIAPIVSFFSAVNSSNIVNINWTVSDTGGSHLDRIEIWRAPDNGGVPGAWAEVGALRQTITNLNTDSHTGSVTDNPSDGTYWYGLHVVDQAGNVGTESSPISITISTQPLTCDIYVSTSGTDNSTCGTQASHCRNIKYAVEKANSGQTVCVNDGTYSENQINVPEGVSLTSTSQDNTKVTIQPSITRNTYRRYPLILFESPIGTNNPSGQILSYVTLDGDGVSNNGSYFVEAINVHDRDNVEIANCIIKDFYKQIDFYGSNIVVAQSSKNEGNTQYWWNIWPNDPGLHGDDSSFEGTWPGTAVEHVENFQFHDNIMRNCGNKIEDRSEANIGLWMVKDSQIYNNDIDTAGCPGTQGITGTWPGDGPSGCLWNVDFYNNNIKVDLNTDFLGYHAVGTIEIWLMRGGCEFYENICNQGWSITQGKNTIIRDNTIIANPHSYCGWVPDSSNTTHRGSWGFELDGQSYLDAHNNYLEGTSGGFKLGSHARNKIVRTGRIYNNFIIDICGRPFSPAATRGSQVFDYKIYHNTADGRYSTNVDGWGNFQYSCISVTNKDVGSVLEVDFENNIFTDARANYLGLGFCDGQGTYSDINVKNTLYDTSLPNFWRDIDGGVACGTNILGSIEDDPLYVKTGQNADYYKFQSNSSAINAGISTAPIVTDDYWGTTRPQGSAYDIGAYEYGSAPSDTTAPIVNTFTVSQGSAIISWNATDTGGSHLDRIEIWRAPDNGGSPGTWAEVGNLRQTITNQNTNNHTGNRTDNPSDGTYWYGLHAVDQAGNVGYEPSPISINIFSSGLNLIFIGDFETGDFSQFDQDSSPEHELYWSWRQFYFGYSRQIVTNPVRSGGHAARFELRYDDVAQSVADGDSPLKLRTEFGQVEQRFVIGDETIIKLSTYFPDGSQTDDVWEVDNTGELFLQVHSTPDPGETWRSPPFGLYISNEGIVNAHNRWDKNKITIQGEWEGMIVHPIGPVERGKWTDWEVHAKWTYEADGFVKVYKDNQLVFERYGPVCMNDPELYVKFGIYKWPWGKGPSNTQERIVYFDDIKIHKNAGN